MKPTVPIPNSSLRTTPLGVGMATLMREPSPGAQQRLLHAAHEAGFRHFDTAPSYGLGAAEGVLGKFLRTRPDGVTVGTKFGIVARGNAGILRLIQRPARALIRRFPSLRGRATKAVGSAVHVPGDFSLPSAQRSLEASLRALGVDAIDLYLVHDPMPADVTPELADWLVAQKRRGAVRSIGIAGSAASVSAITAAHPGRFDFVQIPSHVLYPALGSLGANAPGLRLTHSVLAVPFARISERVRAEPAWGRQLSAHLDADAAAPGVLPRLLLAWGMHENAEGIVLLGASKESHLRAAPAAVGAFSPARLEAAASFIRSTMGRDEISPAR